MISHHLRDRDDDGSGPGSGNGDFGKTGSGLEQRVWVMQGPDGSVWHIREQGGNALAQEQYLYDSQGKVSIIDHNSNAFGDYVVGLPNSQFTWQNFWRDGRATIVSAPEDPNDLSDTTDIQTYDGLIYFPGGGEYDTLTGAPVAEDVYAYVRASNQYNSQTAVNTQLGGNGTTDTFTHPVGSGGWDTMWDAFWHPGNYGAMGQVSNTDPYHVAKISGWVGTAALTLASGGAYGGLAGALSSFGYLTAGAATGALGGAVYSNYTGSDFWSSVEVGANIGAFAGSFPGALRAAGQEFMAFGNWTGRTLLGIGGMPPPAFAIAGGGALAGAGTEAALEAGAAVGAGVNWGGLFGAGANTLFSLSRPWRGQFGSDLNQPGLFPEDAMSEPIHGHHTWPKALGGNPNQRLSLLLESEHLGPQGIHSGLATFEGGWLYPTRNMTGQQILQTYGEEAVITGLRRFYSQPQWQHLLPDFEEAVAYTNRMRGTL